MKQRKLIRKSLLQFIVCVTILLLVATPVFYWLTKNFYAEDIADLMEAFQRGERIPSLDFEQDIIKGTMIQFGLIVCILGIAVVVMMQTISSRLWRPFDKTLETIEAFKLESGSIPTLPESNVEEFNRLNVALTRLMGNSLSSYRSQKEFAENASHEMQTPLAVFRSKLDLLLQLPGLTAEQASIIQDLYKMNVRLSRLNRNLLLLAKLDNKQYEKAEKVDLAAFFREQMPDFEGLCVGKDLKITYENLAEQKTSEGINRLMPKPIKAQVTKVANRSLLESLVGNLIVNAIRHNKPHGEIFITLREDGFSIANTSDEPKLDAARIFNRFYRPALGEKGMHDGKGNESIFAERNGNGLGLAIAKAICDYHGWSIEYSFVESAHLHRFEVRF